MEQNQKQLTFGEQLVGLTFNPSGNDKVTKVKQICAELADILEAEYREKNLGAMPLSNMLYEKAITEILSAQMNVVKVLTLVK